METIHLSLPSAYLASVKNLGAILEAIQNAQAPDKFTVQFLETLDFKSKNDRPVIAVLKAIGFLTDSGQPTGRYFEYLDTSKSKKVLAKGVEEAYSDLFQINKNAHNMTTSDVLNKMKTLTQGKKGESVLQKMASTFVSLCGYGDFDGQTSDDPTPPADGNSHDADIDSSNGNRPELGSMDYGMSQVRLAYDIHLHLPTSRDPKVYEALFRSLREHLSL